ncbi:MAG: hypothetical protein AB7T27_05265 [Kiritimatiellia bacterium]
MNTNDVKPNWFVRIGIILVVLFLATLVAASFVLTPPPYRISAGIVTILAMIIVLVLSEAFHNFSVGKILTLSREVAKTTGEKEDIKKENAELRQSLVHVATHIQSQVNTTIQTQGADLLRLLGVVKADKKEDEQEDKEETVAQVTPRRSSTLPTYRLFPYVENLVLKKYADKYSLPLPDIIRDIRFTEAFECIDPICNRPVTFDGYLKSPQKEYFLEIKSYPRMMGSMLWDRLYVMLSKVLLYRQAKKINAELILIFAKLPEKPDERPGYPVERFIEVYQPAIASGLLRVETIDVSEDEFKQIENEAQKEREE